MAKLKIGGCWSGLLEVELEKWTVAMLRAEVGSRSNCASDLINLICAGKVLKDCDGSQKLAELGVKNNSKILATRIAAEEGKALKQELMAEEERSARLARVKAAATALSKRHSNGSLPIEDFNIELEDQSGQKVHLGSETDQRAAMMGLMLHANAKHLIRQQQYKDALEVLCMGEEAFSLCNPKAIELVDNVSILQIDMVWCYFMLRDMRWLSEAGKRLAKAREGIERAHGKDSSRVRLLQGGRYPELALHLRLELLEGVVAYHNGQFENSRSALTCAQSKYFQLQVPDEALSLVMSMGYKEREAKRALRMSNQDVEMAVDFLVEEKKNKEEKRKEDVRRRKEIREQKRYGVTAQGKAVDFQKLKDLVSVGFQKELVAEALRRNENDMQKALDDLTNPESNSAIQVDVESRKRRRQRQTENAAIEEFLSMGFERARVVAAVRAYGTGEEALNQLLKEVRPNQTDAIGNNPSSSGSVEAGSSAVAPTVIDGDGGTSTVEKRDAEMEDALAEELQQTDALSDYDIDVAKEGEAISEYLALLSSSQEGKLPMN